MAYPPITYTIYNNSSTAATVTNFAFTTDANIYHRSTLTNFGVTGIFSGTTTATNRTIQPNSSTNFVSWYGTNTAVFGVYTGTVAISASLRGISNPMTVTNTVIISQLPVTDPTKYVIGGPGTGGGGGGGGGGGWDIIPLLIVLAAIAECFTADTLVDMANGTTKRIVDIQEGEQVYNHDRSAINTVTFTEYDTDDKYRALYSPTPEYAPFATVNHPLIIDGEMYAVYPETNYQMYPWLGKNKLLTPNKLIPASGQPVYSLWVDGDHTFRVNGYGTHSIFNDGGGLLEGYRKQFLTKDEVLAIRRLFIENGNNAVYGGYLYNTFLGWMNINSINKINAKVFKVGASPMVQQVSMSLLKLLGIVALPVLKLKQMIRNKNV